MRATAMLLFVATVLIGFGSVSYHWFDEGFRDLQAHQGLLASEECGFNFDEPAVWSCDRELVILRVAELRNARHVIDWSGLMLGLIAGLATCVLALVAGIRVWRGRGSGRRATIAMAILPIVGWFCPLSVLLTGGLQGDTLDYAAGAYAAGAVLAVLAAIRLSAARRASR